MNFSQRTWQDRYYDGELEYAEFEDEYSTELNEYEDFKSEEDYWNSLDHDDDYYLMFRKALN